jgi:hypothetical protein
MAGRRSGEWRVDTARWLKDACIVGLALVFLGWVTGCRSSKVKAGLPEWSA